MRAVVFDTTCRFEPDRPRPEPRPGECLIRVHQAGICATDLNITKGYMNFTGVVGHEFVGTVEAGSPTWRGKRIACEINCVCRTCDMCHAGLANHCRTRTVMGIAGRDGCMADYVAMPEANLHAVPDAVPDEEAVFIEPLAAAYQVLLQCQIERRMTVSVIGAGRLGLLVASVLAPTACRLTVIGRTQAKLDLCEKRGIQAVDVRGFVPTQDRDVVVDCTGSPGGLELAMKTVRPRGTIVLKSTYASPARAAAHRAGGASSPDIPHSEPAVLPDAGIDLSPLVVNEVKLLGSRCGPFRDAINALARRAVDVRPLISKVFPIEQASAAFAAAADRRNVKVLLKMHG